VKANTKLAQLDNEMMYDFEDEELKTPYSSNGILEGTEEIFREEGQ
jgi:hypothetical protein